ncbi:hypothetical protein MFMK1_000403 [Metallumcola ferriviriculae]|uniref:Uroporphyrinogen decarboxylase (URO-D) domain-containing protein n=1 Tax=Metallumcola ferriviriculae TaxID=3039180 RepID=A0AAU0UI75_9FIRM|nr:hypothetical protein MFMK1_000403 [Desulfitibacteraceae bacterium MK1]
MTDGASEFNFVLNGKTPRHILRGEFSLSHELCTILTGNSGEDNYLPAVKQLGFDFFGVIAEYPDKKYLSTDSKGRKVFRDYWGRIFWRLPQGREQLVEYPVVDFNQLKGYQFPSVKEVSFNHSKLLKNRDIFTFGVVDGVFQTAARTMDLLDFLGILAERPKRAALLIEQATEYACALASQLSSLGVDAILVADDVAHYGGLFCSEQTFMRWIAPWEEMLFRHIAKQGKPVFFHSDGNIMSLMDWLSGSVLGVHSLDRCPGMDMAAIKNHYGNKLILMGGMPLAALYSDELVQVRDETSQLISQLSPGGRGYILSTTSGFLTEEINPQALQEMYRLPRG